MWSLCLCFAHFYLAGGIITKWNVSFTKFGDLRKQFQAKASHLKRFDNYFKIMMKIQAFLLVVVLDMFST